MSTNIYYFTGTGNSLVVSKALAQKLGAATLLPIAAEIKKESIYIDSHRIGIVFPMYHHSLPYIVNRFIKKLVNLEGKYIFGVCTFGVNPGITLEHLKQRIEEAGGRLAAGFAVKMPYNYVSPKLKFNGFFKSFSLQKVTEDKIKNLDDTLKRRIDIIYKSIFASEFGILEGKAEKIEHLAEKLGLNNTLQKKVWLKAAGYKGPMPRTFMESILLMDHGFSCDCYCNGCGICTKICPVENIRIINGNPTWLHHCEQCFACLHWCPKESIRFGNNDSRGKTYHHPEVKIIDMLKKE